jgi:hypothetical protein
MISFPNLKKSSTGYEGLSSEEELFKIFQEKKLFNNPVQTALFYMEMNSPSKSYFEKNRDYVKD